MNKYYAQYDINKNGKISNRDFCDTLLAVSSGIRRDEAQILVAQLDKRKSGSIEYKTVLNALQDIGGKENIQPQKYSFVEDNKGSNNVNAIAEYERDVVIKPNTSFEYLPVKRNRGQAEYDATGPELSELQPNDIIRVEQLSPHLPAPSPSPQRTGESRSGRRKFYDKYNQIFGAANAPFRLDVTLNGQNNSATDLDPLQQRRPRRSTSAPAGQRRSTESDLRKINHEKEKNLRFYLSANNGNDDASSVASSIDSRVERFCPPEVLHLRSVYRDSMKSPSRKRGCFDEDKKSNNTSILENIVAADLAGRVSTLRHILKQQDSSKSGSVSAVEFKAALSKAGISLRAEQSAELFDSLCKDGGASKSALAGGRALNIDSFVDRVQMRTCSGAFSHLHGEAVRGKTRNAEEVASCSCSYYCYFILLSEDS